MGKRANPLSRFRDDTTERSYSWDIHAETTSKIAGLSRIRGSFVLRHVACSLREKTKIFA